MLNQLCPYGVTMKKYFVNPYDPTKQTFRDNEDRRGRQLDVTQVRPNDGQNLKETITQPARPTTNN